MLTTLSGALPKEAMLLLAAPCFIIDPILQLFLLFCRIGDRIQIYGLPQQVMRLPRQHI